jgi:hypothetical protein
MWDSLSKMLGVPVGDDGHSSGCGGLYKSFSYEICGSISFSFIPLLLQNPKVLMSYDAEVV